MTAPEKLPAKVERHADELEQRLLDKAQTPQERVAAFELAARVRQEFMIREAAAAVAETGWGKDISPRARAAVARYCLEIGCDPVRHVYVLGGSTVYLNAEFYRDLVAANPDFLRDEWRFIHPDARATKDVNEERKGERVAYGVPEDATGACVVTLHYNNGRGPFVGVNWAGTGADPVGKQEPAQTAHTRAYRKAAMKAEPAWFRSHPRLKEAVEVLTQGKEMEAASGTDEPQQHRIEGTGLMVSGDIPPKVTVEQDDPKVRPLADGGEQLDGELGL